MSSKDVEIRVAPEGYRPRVSAYSPISEVICRRGHPLEKDFGFKPLEHELVNEQLQATAAGGANTQASAGSREENLERFVPHLPQPGWFRLGLEFANNSPYHLIVSQLDFFVTATDKGRPLSQTVTIGEGYCQGGGEGSSGYLYVIKPRSKTSYQPHKRNYINNLQLYVEGLPLPAGGGSSDQQAQQGSGPPTKPKPLRSLPSYKVDLTITGQFVDENRNFMDHFVKELVFHTQSDLF